MSVLFFLLLFSFAGAFLATPRVASWARRRGFSGRDLHKPSQPEVPEQGGIAFIGVFLVAGLIYGALAEPEPWYFLTLALAAVMACLGYADRVRTLRAWEKLAYPALAGVPAAVYMHASGFPWYLVALTPLLFMAACNFTNMLAGFNGLEAGTGVIAAGALGLAAMLSGRYDAGALLLLLASAMLGFLPHNFYPARVFPGDVGTLPVGAVLFLSAAFSGLLPALGLVLLPHAADAALKFVSAGIMTKEGQRPTLVRDGKLYPPEGGNLSLPRVLLRLAPAGERELVVRVYAVEAALALAAVLVVLRGGF